MLPARSNLLLLLLFLTNTITGGYSSIKYFVHYENTNIRYIMYSISFWCCKFIKECENIKFKLNRGLLLPTAVISAGISMGGRSLYRSKVKKSILNRPLPFISPSTIAQSPRGAAEAAGGRPLEPFEKTVAMDVILAGEAGLKGLPSLPSRT